MSCWFCFFCAPKGSGVLINSLINHLPPSLEPDVTRIVSSEQDQAKIKWLPTSALGVFFFLLVIITMTKDLLIKSKLCYLFSFRSNYILGFAFSRHSAKKVVYFLLVMARLKVDINYIRSFVSLNKRLYRLGCTLFFLATLIIFFFPFVIRMEWLRFMKNVQMLICRFERIYSPETYELLLLNRIVFLHTSGTQLIYLWTIKCKMCQLYFWSSRIIHNLIACESPIEKETYFINTLRLC